ncbi:MFS general substrate transporter [Microthyrium microscopicum]|uniref:MFS general substrate transporter n=1 Tax=Microthyrium microscopicum TaxID=703497 RepID=A0A6A6U6Z2_9PEZI|nr:MFS general substrate transporter [Microthyrium microscopicum]
MTCEAYYETHEEPPLDPQHDRCSVDDIEASTSLAVALLSASTTLFGVVNLFVTAWTIKKLGVKNALAIQVFWPAVRLAVQNIGVMVGSSTGILIVQSSQIITIIGGPSGYMLTLNSFVTEVVESKERTGALGKLMGCAMFGTSIGYLAGGLIADRFGIIWPFRVTLSLFLLSTLYAIIFLPTIPASEEASARKSQPSAGISRFFGPLKLLAPQKWILRDGRIQTEYGALILGIGVFAGVLATGYIPVLLQMFSTDVLHFKTRENSYLISLYSCVRGVFLTLVFPRCISYGREWLARRRETQAARDLSGSTTPLIDSDVPELPTEPREFAANQAEEPDEPTKLANKDEQFDFDLLYTKYSLLADGILTGLATFVTQGWQVFVVAALLPFASGTGASAKGTILQMCPAGSRTDALSAITLVEMIARLSTTTLFGIVFAGLAKLGRPELVFACNAAVALLGFGVLLLSRFPPNGSSRWEENEEALDDGNE